MSSISIDQNIISIAPRAEREKENVDCNKSVRRNFLIETKLDEAMSELRNLSQKMEKISETFFQEKEMDELFRDNNI